MQFGPTPLDQLEGAILAHSVKLEERSLKKGRFLDADDVDALRAAGIEEVVAARLGAGDIHEDEAARRVGLPLVGEGLKARAPFTGRVNLYATGPGLLVMDERAVDAFNRRHESITLATLPNYAWVGERQMVATVKVIPFAAPQEAVVDCEKLADAIGLCRARPCIERVGLVQTQLMSTKESILNKTVTVLEERLVGVGAALSEELRCTHDASAVATAIREQISRGIEIVLIAGASAIVDRRDVIPAGIEAAGGEVLHFGMPVDPGNLVLLGRLNEVPIVGLPGCARSPAFNGFDHVLRRLCTGVQVDADVLMGMGVGGLLKEGGGRPNPRNKVARDRAVKAPKVAALVLAAGQSRRMGVQNKLLAPLGGEAMLTHTLRSVAAVGLDDVVVVTGHEANDVNDVLQNQPVRVVHNANYAQGLSTSLATGLRALGDDVEAVVICLGDMPRLSADVIESLLSAYDPLEGRAICVPTWKGKRGNPVLFDAQFFDAMMQVRGDTGARQLLGEHADVVCEVPVGSHAVLEDVDSPAELARVRGEWNSPSEASS